MEGYSAQGKMEKAVPLTAVLSTNETTSGGLAEAVETGPIRARAVIGPTIWLRGIALLKPAVKLTTAVSMVEVFVDENGNENSMVPVVICVTDCGNAANVRVPEE